MNIRSFKQLFSFVVALGLAAVGLSLGVTVHSYVSARGGAGASGLVGILSDLSQSHPSYLGLLSVALCLLGLLAGAIVGPLAAQALVNAANAVEKMSARDKLGAFLGSIAGIVVAVPFGFLLTRVPIAGIYLAILVGIAFCYLGIRAFMSIIDEFPLLGPAQEPDVSPTANCKILDTNVIIDGRIADVCRTGFLSGPLYVPGFVLDELQHIADSSDSLKRARGRRGLDILNSMQKELPLHVRTWDKMLDKQATGEGVDTKLVRLAKALEGVIVTNDFNLNKVAALQGVQVLNVNELANALKPVVLPGETMMVDLVKEGKEPNQGVAYLDDGTMIVVEDGRRFINETLPVVVTSVLQTVAGKMIFARVRDDEGEGFDETSGAQGTDGQNGVHIPSRPDHSRRGPGKKVR